MELIVLLVFLLWCILGEVVAVESGVEFTVLNAALYLGPLGLSAALIIKLFDRSVPWN